MRRTPKEIIKKITIWVRKRGKPRRRWWDKVEEDTEAMKIRYWKAKRRNRITTTTITCNNQ